MSVRERDLHSIFKWSVENSNEPGSIESSVPLAAESPQAATKPEKPDPKWIDIMMGKTDAVRMKELIAVLGDEKSNLDTLVSALDELEMIVETSDNANDMRICGVWPPLFKTWEHPEPLVRMHAVWVAGTAVQNNPIGAGHFADCSGLETLEAKLGSEQDNSVLEKLLLVVSSLGNLSDEWIQKLADHGIYKSCEHILRCKMELLTQNGIRRVLRLFAHAIPHLNDPLHESSVCAQLLSTFADCEDEDVVFSILHFFRAYLGTLQQKQPCFSKDQLKNMLSRYESFKPDPQTYTELRNEILNQIDSQA